MRSGRVGVQARVRARCLQGTALAQEGVLRFEPVKIGLVNIPEELVEMMAFSHWRQ